MSNKDFSAFASSYSAGVTKREYLTAAALQGVAGLCLTEELVIHSELHDRSIDESVATIAIRIADKTIELLEESKND